MSSRLFTTALLTGLAWRASAATLDDVCTTDYVAAHLPADGFYDDYALTMDASSVTANPVTNFSVDATYSVFFPSATFDYCNVTFAYSHDGRNDSVVLTLWLPTPDNFQNRFLSTGGGGYAINSQLRSLPGGVMYGAAAGQTDGGFGAYATDAISTFLVENGTVDWQNIYMFGYQAIRELNLVGREFTKNFFDINSSNSTRLYTYYQVSPTNLFLSPRSCAPQSLTTMFSRDALRAVVRDGVRLSASRMPTTVPPSARLRSALPSSRCSISTPTWWRRP